MAKKTKPLDTPTPKTQESLPETPAFVVVGSMLDSTTDAILGVYSRESIAREKLGNLLSFGMPRKSDPEGFDEYRIEAWTGSEKQLVEKMRMVVAESRACRVLPNAGPGTDTLCAYVACAQHEGGKDIIDATPYLSYAIKAVEKIVALEKYLKVGGPRRYEVNQYCNGQHALYRVWDIKWESVMGGEAAH